MFAVWVACNRHWGAQATSLLVSAASRNQLLVFDSCRSASNWKPPHSSKSSRLGQRNVALTFFRAALTITGVKRKFHVTLIEHNEGVSVSCPELPGCHSQGATVKEALQNIEDAIREYLEVYGEPNTRCEIREMEVVTA